MDRLVKLITPSKGYLYGVGVMLAIPKGWFDKVAITYYDMVEPDYEVVETPKVKSKKEQEAPPEKQ